MSDIRLLATQTRHAFLALKAETDPAKRLAMRDSYLATRKAFVDAKNADNRGLFAGYVSPVTDQDPPKRESIRDLETLEIYAMHLMNNFVVLKTLALPESNFTDLCLSLEGGSCLFESPDEFSSGFLPSSQPSTIEPSLFPLLRVQTSVGTVDVYQE